MRRCSIKISRARACVWSDTTGSVRRASAPSNDSIGTVAAVPSRARRGGPRFIKAAGGLNEPFRGRHGKPSFPRRLFGDKPAPACGTGKLRQSPSLVFALNFLGTGVGLGWRFTLLPRTYAQVNGSVDCMTKRTRRLLDASVGTVNPDAVPLTGIAKRTADSGRVVLWNLTIYLHLRSCSVTPVEPCPHLCVCSASAQIVLHACDRLFMPNPLSNSSKAQQGQSSSLR